MVASPPKVPTNTWVKATWNEYLSILDHPFYQKAKGYYHQGYMRLEMSPLGNPHSRDHFNILSAIAIFTALNNLNLDGHDNCSYRKTGYQEVQPDASFYLGDRAELIPWNIKIINLDEYPAPDLVIEVADASFADDQGQKRLIYQSLGIQEYWIIDVEKAAISAFDLNNDSQLLQISQVLPHLALVILEEALQRSRYMNHGKVSAWLLSQWR